MQLIVTSNTGLHIPMEQATASFLLVQDNRFTSNDPSPSTYTHAHLP